MKNKNIISIVVGAVCLIVSLLEIANWKSLINWAASAESTFALLFGCFGISTPFIGFLCCVYLIVKGGK
jgi:hypothetical protein